MNLILHIFRKNARHLYPEILITLVLTILFAWAAPMQWNFSATGVSVGGGLSITLAPLLRIFLPLIWIVLITRLVQDESLVGDRQFWVTRPYTWPVLLAAKVLFLLVFVYLPLFLMQCYLLHHATMSVAAALPDLLLYHLRLTVIGFLPIFAIATVTATFARQFLAILGSLVYLVVAATAGSYLTGRNVTPPGLTMACLVIAAAIFLAALLLQYTSRRTLISRLVLVGLPVILLIVAVAAPAKMLVEHAFPASSATYSLRFDTNPVRQQPGADQPLVVGSYVLLSLPVDLTGLAPGTRLKASSAMVELDTAQGFHWSSSYQTTDSDFYQRNPVPAIDVVMPVAVFNRIRATPVDLHLSLAVLKYGTAATQTLEANLPGFATPGRGFCPMDGFGYTRNCLYPLRQPPPIDLSAQVASSVCAEAPAAPHTVSHAALGSDEDTLTYDFDPVSTRNLFLALPPTPNNVFQPAFLCPGAQVTLTPHFVEGRERISLSQTGLILAPYARHVLNRRPNTSVIVQQP